MKLKNIIKHLFIISITFIVSTNSFSANKLCGSNLITYVEKNTLNKKLIHFNEIRNDSGIFFDFDWDKEQKKIVIKRNKDNFPIIRYSFFDKKNFINNKTAIKKIDSKDLSLLSDKDLEKLTYLTGKINFELENGKKSTIITKPYKLNDFKLSDFEILSIQILIRQKVF